MKIVRFFKKLLPPALVDETGGHIGLRSACLKYTDYMRLSEVLSWALMNGQGKLLDAPPKN